MKLKRFSLSSVADFLLNTFKISGLKTTAKTVSGAINENQAGVAANSAAISTNTADIGTNKTNIATNASDIETLKTDVATNKSNISSNSTSIGTNAENIASNTRLIQANTDSISSLNQSLANKLSVNDARVSRIPSLSRSWFSVSLMNYTNNEIGAQSCVRVGNVCCCGIHYYAKNQGWSGEQRILQIPSGYRPAGGVHYFTTNKGYGYVDNAGRITHTSVDKGARILFEVTYYTEGG